MMFARSIRTFVVLLLVTVQPATASLAAQVAARGGPCPVHAALAAQEQRGAMHHGHAEQTTHSGHSDHSDRSDEGQASPADTNFSCCVAHALGMPVSHAPLPHLLRANSPETPIERGLDPRTQPGDDPPPRILL
jgi:hypothetical protein